MPPRLDRSSSGKLEKVLLAVLAGNVTFAYIQIFSEKSKVAASETELQNRLEAAKAAQSEEPPAS
jgi:hypothetical protein